MTFALHAVYAPTTEPLQPLKPVAPRRQKRAGTAQQESFVQRTLDRLKSSTTAGQRQVAPPRPPWPASLRAPVRLRTVTTTERTPIYRPQAMATVEASPVILVQKKGRAPLPAVAQPRQQFPEKLEDTPPSRAQRFGRAIAAAIPAPLRQAWRAVSDLAHHVKARLRGAPDTTQA